MALHNVEWEHVLGFLKVDVAWRRVCRQWAVVVVNVMRQGPLVVRTRQLDVVAAFWHVWQPRLLVLNLETPALQRAHCGHRYALEHLRIIGFRFQNMACYSLEPAFPRTRRLTLEYTIVTSVHWSALRRDCPELEELELIESPLKNEGQDFEMEPHVTLRLIRVRLSNRAYGYFRNPHQVWRREVNCLQHLADVQTPCGTTVEVVLDDAMNLG